MRQSRAQLRLGDRHDGQAERDHREIGGVRPTERVAQTRTRDAGVLAASEIERRATKCEYVSARQLCAARHRRSGQGGLVQPESR